MRKMNDRILPFSIWVKLKSRLLMIVACQRYRRQKVRYIGGSKVIGCFIIKHCFVIVVAFCYGSPP